MSRPQTPGPQNLVILRHIAVDLLKQKTAKMGISAKRPRAGWNEESLRTVLAGLFQQDAIALEPTPTQVEKEPNL